MNNLDIDLWDSELRLPFVTYLGIGLCMLAVGVLVGTMLALEDRKPDV